MYGIPRGWGGTCGGVCITDQIADHSAPYCNEPSAAVTNKTWVLAERWWMQQEMNTSSVRHLD